MSAHLILAMLEDEYLKRGGFPVEDQAEIAQVIKARVDAVRDGVSVPPVVTVPLKPMPQASWYEREPGEEG